MTKTLLALLTALFIVGCGPNKEVQTNVEPALVVGKSVNALKLNDQFEKQHVINADTTKLIFAFSKDMAHTCNDFFASKDASYLGDNHTQFIADVSGAPSLIKSMFIMPGLKDFKHTVLIFEQKETAAPFKAKQDAEKIIIAYLNNGTISSIKTISTEAELAQVIESK